MLRRAIFVLMSCALITSARAQNLTRTSQNQAESVPIVLADADGLSLVPRDQIPRHGTFWFVRNDGSFLLPMPFPPDDLTVPVFQIGEGQFLVDETDGNLPQPSRIQ